jgi:hypothetical protein
MNNEYQEMLDSGYTDYDEWLDSDRDLDFDAWLDERV